MAEANVKKEQMEYIGIGILVLIALFIGISKFQKKTDDDDEIFSRKAFNKKWKEVKVLETQIPKEEKGIEYPLKQVGRVPFKSPFEDEESPIGVAMEGTALPAMTFQGMIWNSVRPQAIINNKVYDIDDTIDIDTGADKSNVKVKDITKEGIHLKYKGKEFIVRPK